MNVLRKLMTLVGVGSMIFFLTACAGLNLQEDNRNDYFQNVYTFPVHDEQGNEVSPSIMVNNATAELLTGIGGSVMAVRGSDLPEGHAVTAWWVIFNRPEMCSDGVCGEDDVLPMPGNEAAGVSVLFADGQVINNEGNGFFWDALGRADTMEAVFGPGLTNPLTAEIHYVLRTHGPVQENIKEEQLTTLMGGCAAEAPHAPCKDLQYAVFKQAAR